MKGSRVLLVLSLLATARTIPSCADESIVLATVPSSDAGTPFAPVKCGNKGDCPAGAYCSKTSCSDTTGTCALFPVDCDLPEAPVCGCDSITYFNDCLRQVAGIAASTVHECDSFDNATLCGGASAAACPDPSTQVCALLQPPGKGPCLQDVPGTCWVLPATCSTAPDGTDRWDSCADQGDCIDTCTAIRSGVAYRRSSQCSPPPPTP